MRRRISSSVRRRDALRGDCPRPTLALTLAVTLPSPSPSSSHHARTTLAITLAPPSRPRRRAVAHAATNLSFIYFHEGDHQNAIKYADLAMKHNRYNAKALVNKGNCMFMRGEFDHARSMYQVTSPCVTTVTPTVTRAVTARCTR